MRFEVDSAVWTSEIGGHFQNRVAGEQIFGAIVQLDDLTDFPDSYNLSTGDVLDAALLSPTDPSSEISTPLNVLLEPGSYALVFGSDLLGATGRAAMPGGNTAEGSDIDIDTPLYFYLTQDGGVPVAWVDGGFDHVRMFVNEGAAPIPEPSVMLLFVVGSIVIGGALKRRVRRSDVGGG